MSDRRGFGFLKLLTTEVKNDRSEQEHVGRSIRCSGETDLQNVTAGALQIYQGRSSGREVAALHLRTERGSFIFS